VRGLLAARLVVLRAAAAELLAHETLTGDELRAIVERATAEVRPQVAAVASVARGSAPHGALRGGRS